MILKYNCPACGLEIITRYLMPGDKLNCPECNSELAVPENAAQTDQDPNIFNTREHPIPWPPPLLEEAVTLVEGESASPEPTPWNTFSVLKFIAALIASVALISIILGIVVAFIMAPFYPKGDNSKELFTADFMKVFEQIISFTVMVMPPALIYLSVVKRHHNEFLSALHLFRMTRQELIRYMLIGAGCASAVMALLGLLIVTGLDKNIPKDMPIFDEFRNGYGRLIIYTILALLAPAAEELVFRGYIFQGIRNSFGIKVSAIIVTALFIMLHAPQLGYSILPLLMLCVVSVTLIWVRIKTDSLTKCIVIHQIYNTILLLIIWSMVWLVGLDKMAA
jgi:membrane protease YdiL (CAAX protease family)